MTIAIRSNRAALAAALCLAAAAAGAVARAAEPGGQVTGFWRCEHGSQVVLADRPCGEDAVREGVRGRDINGYEPVAPPRSGESRRATPRPERPARAAPTDRAAQRRRAECARIGRQLDRIESEMRTGYSGRRGERLRARSDELTQRRHALRCRAAELRAEPPP